MFEQQYAMTMLILMTTMNALLGILMIAEIISVPLGMTLAFLGMFGMICKCKQDLMGNVKLWKDAYKRHNNDK